MKRISWFAVFPYIVIQSSGIPSTKTVLHKDEIFFDCKGLSSKEFIDTCNEVVELVKTAGNLGYVDGRHDQAQENPDLLPGDGEGKRP